MAKKKNEIDEELQEWSEAVLEEAAGLAKGRKLGGDVTRVVVRNLDGKIGMSILTSENVIRYYEPQEESTDKKEK